MSKLIGCHCNIRNGPGGVVCVCMCRLETQYHCKNELNVFSPSKTWFRCTLLCSQVNTKICLQSECSLRVVQVSSNSTNSQTCMRTQNSKLSLILNCKFYLKCSQQSQIMTCKWYFQISNATAGNQFNVQIVTFNITKFHVLLNCAYSHTSSFGKYWLHQHTSDICFSPLINTIGIYF